MTIILAYEGESAMSELKPSTMTSQAARRVVASFERYEEAQRAVDYLSDEKFPVERVAIVGEGLRLVEQVTGRLTWWRATVKGVLLRRFYWRRHSGDCLRVYRRPPRFYLGWDHAG